MRSLVTPSADDHRERHFRSKHLRVVIASVTDFEITVGGVVPGMYVDLCRAW